MSGHFLRRYPLGRLAVTGLAVALWGCQTGAPGAPRLTAEQAALQNFALEAARAAEARQDYAAAAGHYSRLSADAPADIELALATARNLRRAGEPQQALKALETVLSTQPDNADVLLESGLCHIDNGQLAQAEPILRKVQELAPQDWRAHTALGVVLERQGRAVPALAAFETAARLAPPGTAEAANNLAMAYALAGRLDEAIARLRELGPDAPAQVHRNLAILIGLKQ